MGAQIMFSFKAKCSLGKVTAQIMFSLEGKCSLDKVTARAMFEWEPYLKLIRKHPQIIFIT